MSYKYKPDIKYSESEYNRSTLSNIQPTNLIYEENKRLHEELLEKNLEIQEILGSPGILGLGWAVAGPWPLARQGPGLAWAWWASSLASPLLAGQPAYPPGV